MSINFQLVICKPLSDSKIYFSMLVDVWKNKKNLLYSYFNLVIAERDLVNKYLTLSRKIDSVPSLWLNYCNMYMWHAKMIFTKHFVFKPKGKINVMAQKKIAAIWITVNLTVHNSFHLFASAITVGIKNKIMK